MQQYCINFGMLVSYFIQFGMSYLSGSASWRLAMGLQMIIGRPSLLISSFRNSHLTRPANRLSPHDDVFHA